MRQFFRLQTGNCFGFTIVLVARRFRVNFDAANSSGRLRKNVRWMQAALAIFWTHLFWITVLHEIHYRPRSLIRLF